MRVCTYAYMHVYVCVHARMFLCAPVSVCKCVCICACASWSQKIHTANFPHKRITSIYICDRQYHHQQNLILDCYHCSLCEDNSQLCIQTTFHIPDVATEYVHQIWLEHMHAHVNLLPCWCYPLKLCSTTENSLIRIIDRWLVGYHA